jgi:hypothetical protein
MEVKSRNFSLTKEKQNGTCDNGNVVGWMPGYEAKSEGVGFKTARYDKNYARMQGTCKDCTKFTGKKGTNGEHCDQPVDKGCIF